MKKFSWKVEGDVRLGGYVALMVGYLSKKEVKRRIDGGACKVNGRVECFASRKVRSGDEVEFVVGEDGKGGEVDIIYEDDYFIAVNKPAGMICDGNFLKGYHLIHRLDRFTSGLLLLAKSEEFVDKMKPLFSNGKIKKSYIAVVDKKVKDKEGKIECLLRKKNNQGKILYEKADSGKFSTTLFTTLKVENNYSILRCFPLTGRTHQIRVHMLLLGHPILGDYQYCQSFSYPHYLNRTMLHSETISFHHPKTSSTISLFAPYSQDFYSFFEGFALELPEKGQSPFSIPLFLEPKH